MNLTIATAIKQGGKPQEPGKAETHFCQAGCGRANREEGNMTETFPTMSICRNSETMTASIVNLTMKLNENAIRIGEAVIFLAANRPTVRHRGARQTSGA